MKLDISEYSSCSVKETEAIGFEFGRSLAQKHDLSIESVFIAMYGTLGAGKTAFVRGMASSLAPKAQVTSPTYAIVNEYKNIDLSLILAHFDMYRVTSEEDLFSCGFDDYFRPGIVIVAEWSENIAFALPDDFYSVEIEITGIDDNCRKITIQRNKALN